MTDAITYYLAKDLAPINTVQKMINTLDKHHTVPSRNYCVALPYLYTQCRTRVETELGLINHFAATKDLWSSQNMESCFT